MITVPALKVRQFGVEFYQTSFASSDIQKLVKFEVLNYPTLEEAERRRRAGRSSAVNWSNIIWIARRPETCPQSPEL